MNEFIDVFQDRKNMLLETAWEHLQISLTTLVIAILIAVPLGLLLTRYLRVAEPIINVAAVLQTIPSLAVLAFLIPFFGIGTKPAIIALTIYGLLPILRNTYTGIQEVSPSLKEAATGMGMNSVKRLTKVELPIAMPVIMAGIRTSMVLIVGTTTIAALIGAGGLGELILLGIDRGGDINLILLGAIPAALLAIILDLILRGFEGISRRLGFKSFIAMLIIAVLIVVSPSLFQGKKADLVIGSKLDSEPKILINMYKLLIEDESDLSVELKPGLGKTSFNFDALSRGSIDMYPEFTGTAIVELMDEEAESYDEEEVYEQAYQGMREQFGMVLLDPMAYNNTYTVATKKEFAERYDLDEIGDLKAIEDSMTAGFTLEFEDRHDGYAGMQDVYGLDIADIKNMDPGLREEAIAKDEVDVINGYATDSYMIELDLKTLDDPENLFPSYQGAPLMREETLEKHPELEGILNQLGGEITDEEMRKMNYEVDYNDASPEKVARKFLVDEGLLDG